MTTLQRLQVTDEQISRVLSLREIKKALSKKLNKLEDELRMNESQIIDLIECGCEVNAAFNISINESEKVYPKYKEEIENRLGEKVLKEIINSTKPKLFKKLVIK